MLPFALEFTVPKILSVPHIPETLDWLSQALPFLTFVLGLGVGAALMYIPMTFRLWKLRHRLAKSGFQEPEQQGSTQGRGAIAVRK